MTDVENKKRGYRYSKSRERVSRAGLLKPDINIKAEQFFVRWFNLQKTQRTLKEELKQFRKPKEVKKIEDKKLESTKPDKDATLVPTPVPTNVKPLLSPRRRSTNKNRTSIDTKQVASSTESSPVCRSNKKDEGTSSRIPRFHFPHGQPRPTDELTKAIEGINRAFNKLKNEKLTRQELALIAKELGLGSYWKSALYKAACQPNASLVSKSDVIAMWERIAAKHHDNPSRFVAMLAKPDRSSLDFDDFLCVLQDVVECHPGLVFLRDAPEFHTRYMNTVIARIFYTVNRSWSGCITVPELRRCNFLQTLGMLEDEDDINMICDFFSYEHFLRHIL
uniref:Uncharacterized protein n=1 Tax=Ciona savignyi TaxID=51511 RepID=H2ZEF3_CIOSA